MKKCSTKKACGKKTKSFVLSDKIFENTHAQCITNLLLIFILGMQIFNFVETIKLFDKIKVIL